MSKIKSVAFPHLDENNWLEIEVGGVKRPQYPSPLEVQMMIENDRQAFEEAITSWLEILKRPLKECGQCNACELAMICTTLEADQQTNYALDLAIATIRSIYQDNK